MSRIKSIEQVQDFLDSIPNFRTSGKSAARFDLDHFRRFCNAIGNPQNRFPCIHVGGTNGKGSTCQILASIYQQGGYDVGLYTSPHILNYSERFRINGKEIPDSDVVTFFQKYRSEIENFDLSYFEISTALAFWWFAEKMVDIAVIEVGLGGRLDATNIITPLASVITNVALDHTDILGKTVPEIAREKAGIIKAGVPVIVGNIRDDAKKVVSETAASQGSSLYGVDHLEPFFKDGKHILLCRGKHIKMETGLEAPVQVFNTAVAWQVTQLLQPRFPINQRNIIDGIEQVRTRYPSLGRFDRLLDDKQWYFDGGHNSEAVRSMKQKIETMKPVHESVAVLSLMRDKLESGVINEFLDFKKIFYHSLETERAASFEEVQKWLPNLKPFPADDRHSREAFFKEVESELVIFAGSFYFYSTVRDWLASFTHNR